MNKKVIAKTILINLAILSILLVLCELIFGDWLGSKKINHLALIRNYKASFSIQHLYPWPTTTITYTRDRWGLRGDFGSPQNIDLLTIGGSTTDQRYLDDKATWQTVLQESLLPKQKLQIANAGVDGHTSYGHLKSFSLWFPGIPDLKPKSILVYMGVNDFFRSHGEFDEIETGQGASYSRVLKSNSAIYHLVRTLLGVFLASKVYKVQHSSIPLTNWTQNTSLDASKKEELVAYFNSRNPNLKKSIQQIVKEIQAMGAQAIIVNQPTRFFKKDEQGRLTGLSSTMTINGITASGYDLAEFWNSFNTEIYKGCLDAKAALCLDLNQELGPDFNDVDFYDPFHNTPSGAKKIGHYLAQKMAGSLAL